MFAGTTVSPFVAQANILSASADGSGTMSVAPSTALAALRRVLRSHTRQRVLV